MILRDLSSFHLASLSSLTQFLSHGPKWLLELLPSSLHFSRKGRRGSGSYVLSLRV